MPVLNEYRDQISTKIIIDEKNKQTNKKHSTKKQNYIMHTV